jgi:2-polyprenyl-3-methyl-5-hydroxy-6-metoxy-1,4-benzoquinol methylase
MFSNGPKHYPTHEETERDVLDANTSLSLMVAMIGSGKRVLDVGCASGYFARLLQKNGCQVTGIDANPEALEAAREGCSHMILADLDRESLAPLLEGATFDVVAFGDVLEHLHDPLRVLDQARAALAEDGYIVASIPNIAHGAIRLAMLAGRFDYQEFGLLDESHVRFFTAKTLDEVFLCAGYRVELIERTTLALFEPSDLVPAVLRDQYLPATVAEVEGDPECETLQFVVRAMPLTDVERHALMSRRFLAANTELAAANSRMDAQTRTLDATRVELDKTRGHLAEADREMRLAQQSFREAASARTAALERVSKLSEKLEVSEETGEALVAAMSEIGLLRATLEQTSDSVAELTKRYDEVSAAVAEMRIRVAPKQPAAPRRSRRLKAQKQNVVDLVPKVDEIDRPRSLLRESG